MKNQIDQSGKIEQTNLNTIIAITNSQQMSVLLKKADKRKLEKIFIELGIRKFFPFLVFSATIAVLLKHFQPKQKIYIDNEYTGHEDLIQQKIKQYYKSLTQKDDLTLNFIQVGKLSPSHYLANKTALCKLKPNLVIPISELVNLVIENKKDRDSVLRALERLTQDWLPGDRRSSRSLMKKGYHKINRKSSKNDNK